eukprot:1161734-Pelagomonas_calceolata.AAC.8
MLTPPGTAAHEKHKMRQDADTSWPTVSMGCMIMSAPPGTAAMKLYAHGRAWLLLWQRLRFSRA